MNVNIEVQSALGNTLSGTPQYNIQLTRALLKRAVNDYSLSFFDYNREQNNRTVVLERFGDLSPHLLECTAMHYGYINNYRAFLNKSYNDYIGANPDVFHFTRSPVVPDRINGNVVVTCHDIIPILPYYGVIPYFGNSSVTNASLGLERIFRDRHRVIAVSCSAKEDLLKYTKISDSLIHVVHNGVNHDILFPDCDEDVLNQLGVKRPYFLGFGRLDDQKKNLPRVISAFEIIAEKNPDFQLVLPSSQSPKDIKSFISVSRFSDRIITPGFITEKQRRVLMSGATALVFPSLYEGFGLPIIEAMACGAPVITSNVSSMPEAAGDAGILIDPYDTEQLAFEMERVLNSTELREELSKKGLAHSAKFSWDKAAEETERVYQIAMES